MGQLRQASRSGRRIARAGTAGVVLYIEDRGEGGSGELARRLDADGPALDAILIGSPALDRSLDGFAAHRFVGCLLRELGEFLVRDKSQADDLTGRQTRVEQLPGENVVTQVLLGSNGEQGAPGEPER